MKLPIYSLYFFFNGKAYTIQTYQLLSLRSLLSFFKYDENMVVVEYNGKICNSKIWSFISLKEKDQVEILSIVGGG